MPAHKHNVVANRLRNATIVRCLVVAILSSLAGLVFVRLRASIVSIHWPISERASGSSIVFDGDRLAFTKTDHIAIRVSPGLHNVVLRRPGFTPVKQQIAAASGATVTVSPTWVPTVEQASQSSAARLIEQWNQNRYAPRSSPVIRQMRAEAMRLFWSLPEGVARDRCRQVLQSIPSAFASRLAERPNRSGLSSIVTSLGPTTRRHAGAVTRLCFRPGSRTLLSSGTDGRINVWSLESGELVRTLIGHQSGVADFDISPDGNDLVSGGNDGRILHWNLKDFSYDEMSKPHRAVRSVAFSPDGQQFVTGHADNRIRIWKLGETEPIRELAATHQVRATCWSFDGRYAAGGDSNGRVIVWDQSSDTTTVLQNGPPAQVLGFSPDGAELTVVGANALDATWTLNEPATPRLQSGQDVFALGRDLSWSLQPSDSNSQVAKLIEVRETQAPQEVPLLSDVSSGRVSITAAARAPDTTELAIGHDDGAITVCRTSSERPLFLPSHSATLPISIAASSDGSTLYAGTRDGRIQVWDVFSRTRTEDITTLGEPIVFTGLTNQDRTLIAASETSIAIIDASDPDKQQTFRKTGPVSAAIAGNDIAYVTDEGIVWTDTSEVDGPIRILASNRDWSELQFHPSGKALLAVSTSGEVQRIEPDPESQQRLTVTHAYLADNVTSVAWSDLFRAEFVRPNGQGEWSFTESGTTIEMPRPSSRPSASTITTSCRGTLHIAGGYVHREDASTTSSDEVAYFAGSTCGVQNVACSPNGDYLIVVDSGGQILAVDITGDANKAR